MASQSRRKRKGNKEIMAKKTNKPSVKINFIYRIFYEMLIVLAPFITTPYVSRVLGPEGVGTYSYVSSIMAYFTLFAALGTSSYGEREIAQHRDDRKESSKLFWEIELMTVMTTTICLILWICCIVFVKPYRYYFLALTPLLIGTMGDISWYFMGYEQVKYIVIRNCVCKILGIMGLFLFVRHKSDLLLYIALNSVISMLGNLSMWTYLPRMLVKVEFRNLHFKKHFKETLIYFVPTIATSIYTVLDKTLIGLITASSYENGYYEQATKIINIAKGIVFNSVNAVMGARIAYLFAQEKFEEIRRRIHRSMDFILLLGYGAAFGISGIAATFVPVFFGEGWDSVVFLLYAMSPLIVIIGVSNCLGSQYYTPGGQRARSAKVIVLGSVVNLICNLIFIPFWGGVGATIGSVVAETVISVLYVKMSDGYMNAGLLVKYSWKRLVAGGTMCAAIMMIGKTLQIGAIGVLVVQVAVGVAIYFCILLAFRDTMLQELIGMVKGFITRKKA